MMHSSPTAPTWSKVPYRRLEEVEPSTLMKYIDNKLKGIPTEESSCRIWLRRSALMGGFALVMYGIPGKILLTLTDTARIFGEEDPYHSSSAVLCLGIAASSGNVLYDLAFGINSTIDLVSQVIKPLSTEEKILLKDSLSKCRRVLLLTGSIAIGAFSMFPIAWGAYNASEPSILPPLIGYTMQQVQFVPPALSLFGTFLWLTEASNQKRKNRFVTEIRKRQNALRIPSESRNQLLNISGERKESNVEEEKKMVTPDVLNLLFQAPSLENTGMKTSQTCARVLNCLALALTGFFLTDLFKGSYQGTKNFVGGDVAPYLIASLVSLVSAQLFYSLIRRGLELPYEGLHQASKAPITKELRPKLYKTITYLGIFCSITPTVDKLSGDKGFGSASIPLGIMGSIASLFVGLASTHNFRDCLIKKLSQKELLTIADRKLEEIIETIAYTKPEKFTLFLEGLTPDQRKNWGDESKEEEPAESEVKSPVEQVGE